MTPWEVERAIKEVLGQDRLGMIFNYPFYGIPNGKRGEGTRFPRRKKTFYPEERFRRQVYNCYPSERGGLG